MTKQTDWIEMIDNMPPVRTAQTIEYFKARQEEAVQRFRELATTLGEAR